MKDINIHNLNKDFESRIRLGIMSVLMVNEWVNFNEMKELLELTDGNLASHINALEKNEYIEIRKAFVGKKTETSYRITLYGKNAFKNHIKSLSNLIK
ncbi:MAG: transcriptional regulator [Saprospiraceae bacterium]